MPPIRGHGIVYDEAEDDSESSTNNTVPSTHQPIQHSNKSIDQPYIFTFMSDMTPMNSNSNSHRPILTFHSSTHVESVSPMILSTPPDSPLLPTESMISNAAGSPRGSHGKKRDASYIPRPPNAFILFRSSFIRDQQVPGKVEGNHSTLSKIIGMYWKTLPKEERQKWEEKAVVAQAEHRMRYPDWRFRPGSNAIAKLKVKEEGHNQPRKRNGGRSKYNERSRETQSEDGSKDRGKGRTKAKDRMLEEDRRCAKIADLLKSGKKGSELEAAIREWEGKGQVKANGPERDVTLSPAGLDPKGSLTSEVDATRTDDPVHAPSVLATIAEPLHSTAFSTPQPDQAQSPEQEAPPPDFSSSVPLTAMFRRPQSAPSNPHSHQDQDDTQMLSSPSHAPVASNTHIRRETVSFPTSPEYHQGGLFQPDYQRISGYEKRSSVDTRWPDVEALRCRFDPQAAVSERLDCNPMTIINITRPYSPTESGDSQHASYQIEWRAEHSAESSPMDSHNVAVTTGGIPANSALFASERLIDINSCPSNTPSGLLSERIYYPGLPASSFSTLAGWAGGDASAFACAPNGSNDPTVSIEGTKQLSWQVSKRPRPIGLEGGSYLDEANRSMQLSVSVPRSAKHIPVPQDPLQSVPSHYTSTSADSISPVNAYHHHSPVSPHNHHYYGHQNNSFN